MTPHVCDEFDDNVLRMSLSYAVNYYEVYTAFSCLPQMIKDSRSRNSKNLQANGICDRTGEAVVTSDLQLHYDTQLSATI